MTHPRHPAAPFLTRILTEDGDDGSRLPNGLRPGFVERQRDSRIREKGLCGKVFGPVPNPPVELCCYVCERRPNHNGKCSEEGDPPMPVRPEFKSVPITPDAQQKIYDVEVFFSEFLCTVEAHCGKEGRDMALLRTHLEDAVQRARSAIASRPENQR